MYTHHIRCVQNTNLSRQRNGIILSSFGSKKQGFQRVLVHGSHIVDDKEEHFILQLRIGERPAPTLKTLPRTDSQRGPLWWTTHDQTLRRIETSREKEKWQTKLHTYRWHSFPCCHRTSESQPILPRRSDSGDLVSDFSISVLTSRR